MKTPQKLSRKIPHHYSPLLLLMLVASFFTAACERVEPLEEVATTRSIQAARPAESGGIIGPNGPCNLDEFNTSFPVDAEIFPPTLSTFAYDFAIELKHTTGCEASLDPDIKCHMQHGQYNLQFIEYPNLSGVFESIIAFDLNAPNEKILYKTMSDGTIIVGGDAIIYFKWANSTGKHVPTVSELRTDGICIIGILTEPCPWCPPHGGHPLTRLNPVHPFGH